MIAEGEIQEQEMVMRCGKKASNLMTRFSEQAFRCILSILKHQKRPPAVTLRSRFEIPPCFCEQWCQMKKTDLFICITGSQHCSALLFL
jgi:hypothetical protein